MTCLPHVKQKQKRKKPKNSKAENPTKRTRFQGKSYWSMITHVIFDLIGNNLQNQVMTYLWFGIRMKHLPVWDWYTLSDFLLSLLDPVFPLNGRLAMKCWHPKPHLRLWENFISILSFPNRHIVFHKKLYVSLISWKFCFFTKACSHFSEKTPSLFLVSQLSRTT